MKSSKEILSSLLKTAQISQLGIRTVLDKPMRPVLRSALQSQLREFDKIESEAHAIASQRGWELPELDPAVRFFSEKKTRIKLSHGHSDSRIADMMIRDNTRGMIRELRNLHQFPSQDCPVSTLSQRLLDCEAAGIRQLQLFL